ncbi:phytanoyl-CoA dioxygenase family protein [Candidatus Pelagibacter sp.]|nr:phytanoyl-CoA dioxygenase family protein [Candidatus Pelagibacter sp.]
MISNKINLNKEQISFYKKNGYLIIENFLKKDRAQKIKKYALKNLAEKPKYAINLNVHRRDKLFYNIISNKNLINIVKKLQNSPIVALNDQMIYKKRNTAYAGQAWTIHQDNAYIGAPKNSYIIAHLFLDDSTPKNGGLVFWAKSHKEGILKFNVRKSHKEKISKSGISRPGWKIKDNEIKKLKKKYEPIKIDGKSGWLCFMHGNLVHSSTPNKSKTKDRATYSMAFLNKKAKFKGKGYNSIKVKYKLN